MDILSPDNKSKTNLPDSNNVFKTTFPGYFAEPNLNSPKFEEFHFPNECISVLSDVGGKTKNDGNERLVKMLYNTLSGDLAIETRDEWVHKGGFIGSELISKVLNSYGEYPMRFIGLGHSHPDLVRINRQHRLEYGRPDSSVFLSPDDMYLFLTNLRLPPFFFVFDSTKAMLAVKHDETKIFTDSRIDFLYREFYNQSRMDFNPTQATLANFIKTKTKPLNPDFDIIRWNMAIANKFNFDLYYGNFYSLKKISSTN